MGNTFKQYELVNIWFIFVNNKDIRISTNVIG